MQHALVINNKLEKVRKKLLLGLLFNLLIPVFMVLKVIQNIGFTAMGVCLIIFIFLFSFHIMYSVINAFHKTVEHFFMKYGRYDFVDFKLDVEKSVNSENLAKSKVFGGFIEQESFSAVIGSRYLASEELLYSKIGKKENLKKVKFEGVIVEIEAGKHDIRAKVVLNDGQGICYGNLEEIFRKKIVELMKVLGVADCIIDTVDGQLYIGFNGGKIYHQFNIFKKIDVNKNESRIVLFNETVEALVDEILL